MALDINGFVLTGGSDFSFGAAGAKIDSGGRVISPNYPAMHGSTIIDGSVVSEYPQNINSVTLNSGAWTGNTTFTAPVAGLYFVSTAHIVNGSGNNTVATDIKYGYIGIIKNGAVYGFNCWYTNDAWTPSLFQTMVQLAVGDTIQISVNTAPSPAGNSPGMYRSNHNSTTITLIG
jgi:hypothetical protein